MSILADGEKVNQFLADYVSGELSQKSRVPAWSCSQDLAYLFCPDFRGEEFVQLLKSYIDDPNRALKLLDFVCNNESITFNAEELASLKQLRWRGQTGRISELRDAKGNGLTIKLREAHRQVEPLTEALRHFSGIMAEPLGLNIYYTTPNSGLCIPAHRDAGDIFVLQIEGSKRWFLESTVSASDLSTKPDGGGLLDTEVLLVPGDVLFVPRQLAHRTETVTDRDSLHLTIQGNSSVTQWLSDSLRFMFAGEAH